MSKTKLETDRLVLRPLRSEDVEGLDRLFAEPVVRRYLLDGERMPRSWVEEVVADSAADFAAHGHGLWVGSTEQDGPPVVVTGYRNFFEPPVLELIWIVRPQDHGQGLAVEAAGAALSYGFRELGFDPIRASVDEPNVASLRVAEKLGFRETGRDPGSFGATIHFALRRDEFTSP